MAVSSDDALITGLSAYFLDTSLANNSLKPEECRTVAKIGKDRVLKAIKNINDWKKEASREATDIHITIIKKYIYSAGDWLFLKSISDTIIRNDDIKLGK